ncbi:hypothetical protein JXM67_13325 [candidate division WOR-3 bacterium]|nr:hypothetical protein [candidate division WOR-3 bacterium]
MGIEAINKSLIKQVALLIFASALAFGLSCKKELALPEKEPEYQELVLIGEEVPGIWKEYGSSRCSITKIDVTDWEEGRDAVPFMSCSVGDVDMVCYPWQGEDTIIYSFDGDSLWINQKLVGLYISTPEDLKSYDPGGIVCIGDSWAFNLRRYLRHFSQARTAGIYYSYYMKSGIWFYIWMLGIRKVPKDVDMYVFFTLMDRIDLRVLSRVRNIRWLLASTSEPCRFPRGFRGLRRLALAVHPESDLRNLARLDKQTTFRYGVQALRSNNSNTLKR